MVRIIFFLIMLLSASALFGEERIEDYRVDIRLNQDGSLAVEETIRYDFGDHSRHGIFRDIPETARTETDGAVDRDIGLGGFKVSGDMGIVPYDRQTVYGDSGRNVRLKIGDPSRYVSGVHTYRIGYTVAHGVTTKGGDDALRWNAVGTGWNVPIDAVTVTVRFPQTLSAANVQFAVYKGPYGSTERGAAEWTEDRTLQASAEGLQPHEGLTIEAAFARDTLGQNGEPGFVESLQLWIRKYWGWLAAAGIWLFMHWYWSRKGRDAPKRSVAVRYEAPAGLDVMQAGLLFDQFADDDDLSPAIVELADKGYLKIVKTENKTVLKDRGKSPEGLTASQRELMGVFFDHGDSFEFPIPTGSTAYALQSWLHRIGDALYQWSYDEKYMQKNPKKARSGFLAITGLLFVFLFVLGYYGSRAIAGPELGVLAGFALFGLFGLLHLLSSDAYSKIKGILIFVGLYIVYQITDGIGYDDVPLDWTLLLDTPLFPIVLATVPAYVYYKKMGAYTQKGAQIYAWLLGYREFIKRVEIDEVKRRMKEEPTFLNRVLPYAMLFGMVGRWMDIYAAVEAGSASWYDGDFDDFASLHDTIDTAGPSGGSSSAGASGFSGGFSGGGSFSGGGFGGGGGGSW